MDQYSSDSSYESDSGSDLEQVVIPKQKARAKPAAPQPVDQKPKRNYVKKQQTPEDAERIKQARIQVLAKAREAKAAKKQQQQKPPPQPVSVQPKPKQKKTPQIVNNYYYTNEPTAKPEPQTPRPQAKPKQQPKAQPTQQPRPPPNIFFV